VNAPPQLPGRADETLRFLHAYWTLWQTLSSHADDLLRTRFGLDLRDFIALSYLTGPTPLTPSDLVREMHLPKYVISRTLEHLARHEAVTSSTDPADGRRLHYTLTPHGEELQRSALHAIQGQVRPALAALGPHASELTRHLEHLLAAATRPPGHRKPATGKPTARKEKTT